MSATNPPDPNVNTFNNLYWITGDTALTQEVADKRYLRFPSAQGTENLQAINVNGVSQFNSNINVGSATAPNLTPVVNAYNSDVYFGNGGQGKVNVECELYIGGFGELTMTSANIDMNGDAKILQAPLPATETNNLSSTSITAVAGTNPLTINATANPTNTGLVLLSAGIDMDGASKITQDPLAVGNTNSLSSTSITAVAGTNPLTIDATANPTNTGLVLTSAGIVQSGSVVNGLQNIAMNSNQSVSLSDGGSVVFNDYGINVADNFSISTDPVGKNFKMSSNTTTGTTDIITYFPQTNLVNFPATTAPTSSQTIPAASDSSNKIPTTAWVQSAIAAAPSPPTPADLTPNSVSIVPTTSPPNLACGVKNYYNEGAIVAVDTYVPYNLTTGSKQLKQYFARLVFNPARALGGGSNLAGIYQNTQVRTTLSLTDNNNVQYWGTQYGVINYYSTATIALNYNYQQYYNVNLNTKDNNSQGVSFILKNTSSNNSGGYSGIIPDIWVEKFAGQNWYNFYFLNGSFSSGGSSGFVTDWYATFTIELLNGGQSVNDTSSVWLEEYVVAVNV